MSSHKIQRALVITLIALGVALLCVDLLLEGRPHVEPEPAVSQNMYAVVRAANPMSRGAIIRPQDVALTPSTNPPPMGSITQIGDAAGRVVTRDVAASEPLSSANTTRTPYAAGLAELIPKGMRAVALRVTDELAVANLIRPGDHVDVLVISHDVRAGRGEAKTFPDAEVRTILQNIRVLAVGEAIVGQDANSRDYRNVTLAVTPKDAGMIALARAVGTQYLSLRAADDASRSLEASTLTTDDLHLDSPSPQDPGERHANRTAARPVEIILGAGTQRETAMVPKAEGQ